jgi:hypothetical protein
MKADLMAILLPQAPKPLPDASTYTCPAAAPSQTTFPFTVSLSVTSRLRTRPHASWPWAALANVVSVVWSLRCAWRGHLNAFGSITCVTRVLMVFEGFLDRIRRLAFTFEVIGEVRLFPVRIANPELAAEGYTIPGQRL